MGGGQSSWLQRQNHRAWEVGTAASRHFSPWLPGASSPSAGGKFPCLLLGQPRLRITQLLSRVLGETIQVPHRQSVKSFPRYTGIQPLLCFQTSKGSQCQGVEPQMLSLLFEVLCNLALTPFHAILCYPLARDSHPCLQIACLLTWNVSPLCSWKNTLTLKSSGGTPPP